MAIRETQRRSLGRPANWDDLLALPDDLIGEIVAGELVVSPRPDPPHAHSTSALGVLLGGPFGYGIGGPGGWVFLDEPRVRFARDTRVSDLAAWRAERWPGLPRNGPIRVIPDWICEVLSRGTETEDRTTKFHLYAREKVSHLWFVNPRTKTLEVYRLESGGWRVVGTWAQAVRVRAEPFEAIELDLDLLWGRLMPDDDEEEEEGDE